MLKASDIMTQTPVTVLTGDDIMHAAQLLLENGFNGLPVVDANGDIKGVICQSDLIAQQKKLKLPSVFTLLDGLVPLSSLQSIEKEMEKMTAATVAQAMTPSPKTVSPQTPVDELATLMVDNKLRTLPVVEDGKLVGIVGMGDVLRTLLPGEK